MKIVVTRHELKAALLFTSSDESRYVLNGLLIEARPESKPTLIATDGRRLVVIETVAEQSEDFDQSFSMLLRGDFCKAIWALSKSLGGKLFPWIEIESRPGSQQVNVAFVGSKCFVNVEEGALIEGQYPNWRQVVPPKRAQRQPINDLGLNAEFMGDFAKAAKIMESEPIMQMNLIGKEQAIEVRLQRIPNFYGLIMPCKAEEADYQPEFLKIIEQLPKTETKTGSGEEEVE